MIGKEVSRSLMLTDDVKPQSLSLSDQIRLILSKLSNNDVAELEASTRLTTEYLEKVAKLSTFIDESIEEMKNRNEVSVTVKLGPVFRPYLQDVVDSKTGKGRFYDFHIHNEVVESYKEQDVIMTIRKKRKK